MRKRISAGVLILILVGCLFFLQPTKQSQVEKKEVTEPTIKEEVSTKRNDILSLKEKYQNQDIIGELFLDDLGIDAVITKTNDNSYYLNHDIYQEESKLGNPYIDFRNSNDLEHERQINIYSHNSDYDDYKEELPFNKLENYLEKEKFEHSGIIELQTENSLMKYEVVAIKIITTDNEHTVLDSKSEERWNAHLSHLLEDTKYCKKDCQLTKEDQLLILQTCNYDPKGSYILLISKKINEKEKD